VLAGAAVLIAAGWGYAALSLRADHRHTLDEERGELRTVTAGLEMQVESMLNDGIGAALAGANVVSGSGELADLGSTRTAEMLGDMLTGGDYVRSLFLASRTSFIRVGRGNVRVQGAPPDWLGTLISRSGNAESMVGLRMVDPERPEHYVIPVVRRLGSQEAWVGGLFDFHEVNDLYRRSMAASSALLLLGEDGSTLVRVPNRVTVGVISGKIAESGVFARGAPAVGFIESVGDAKHAPVFVAFQRVRGYPMFAASGTSLEAVLAPWEARRRNTVAFTAIASLAIAAMTWMLNHYITALWRRDVEYRALFNNAGFSAFTMEGEHFRDANRTTLSMFGLSDPRAARGLTPWDFSPEMQPDGTLSQVLARRRMAVAQFEGQARFEWLHKRMDTGETFPAEVELSTVLVDGCTLTLAVVHDLTERKRAEQSWRESEARYRALIDSLPEAVFVHRGKELLFGNQAAATILGAPSVEALSGFPVMSFVAENDREIFRERTRRILEHGTEAQPREVRLRRFDGSMIWAESQGVQVIFDGKPAVQGIVRDVTDRKLQEEARTEAEARIKQQSEALLNLATRLEVSTADLKPALQRICMVADFVLDAARVEVWAFEKDAMRVRRLAAFSPRTGSPAVGPDLVESRLLPRFLTVLQNERVIEAHEVQEDPAAAELAAQGIVGSDIASVIAAPVRAGGDVVGFALVSHRGSPRDWHADEVIFAGGIADQIAQAFLDAERERAFNELRDLAGQLVRAESEVRRRVGRDLHDSTGQLLATLELSLARLATDTLDPECRTAIGECVELARRCSAEIRTASYLLHPPLLDELGLASALRWLVDGFRERSGIDVTLDIPTDFKRLDSDSELALFRVAQEALTNVLRHSGSHSARIKASAAEGAVSLQIEDDGRGMPQGNGHASDDSIALSVGMAGMRERMRQIGGSVSVESAQNGTRVRATVPFSARV
jgi:PAS domain S-box-containing protein